MPITSWEWWSYLVQPLLMVASCLISIFVILGNLLVMSAIWHENQLHSVTNYLIASLAAADCLVGALVMPFSIISEVIMSSWTFGATWCDLWHSFDVLASTASILNLCAISLDRYLAITDPISYPSKMTPNRVTLLIISVWACSSLISFPAILWWRSVSPSPLEPITPKLPWYNNASSTAIMPAISNSNNIEINNNKQKFTYNAEDSNHLNHHRLHQQQLYESNRNSESHNNNFSNKNTILNHNDATRYNNNNNNYYEDDESATSNTRKRSTNDEELATHDDEMPNHHYHYGQEQQHQHHSDNRHKTSPNESHMSDNDDHQQPNESISSYLPTNITPAISKNSSILPSSPSSIQQQQQQYQQRSMPRQQKQKQTLSDEKYSESTFPSSPIDDKFAILNNNNILSNSIDANLSDNGVGLTMASGTSNNGEMQYRCVFTNDTSYLLFSSVISFYGPLVIMVYAYYRIYRAAVEQKRFLKHGTKEVLHSYGRKSNISKAIKGVCADQQLLVLRAHRGGGASTTSSSFSTKPKAGSVRNSNTHNGNNNKNNEAARQSMNHLSATLSSPGDVKRLDGNQINSDSGSHDISSTDTKQQQQLLQNQTNNDDKTDKYVSRQMNDCEGTTKIEPCKPCQHHTNDHRKLDHHHYPKQHHHHPSKVSFNHHLNSDQDHNQDETPCNICGQDTRRCQTTATTIDVSFINPAIEIDRAKQCLPIATTLTSSFCPSTTNACTSCSTVKCEGDKINELVAFPSNDKIPTTGHLRNENQEESIASTKEILSLEQKRCSGCTCFTEPNGFGDKSKKKQKLKATSKQKETEKKRHSLCVVPMAMRDKVVGKSLKDYFYDDHKLQKPVNNYDLEPFNSTAHQRQSSQNNMRSHDQHVRPNVLMTGNGGGPERSNKLNDCLESMIETDHQCENVCHKPLQTSSHNNGAYVSPPLSSSSAKSTIANGNTSTTKVVCFNPTSEKGHQIAKSSSVDIHRKKCHHDRSQSSCAANMCQIKIRSEEKKEDEEEEGQGGGGDDDDDDEGKEEEDRIEFSLLNNKSLPSIATTLKRKKRSSSSSSKVTQEDTCHHHQCCDTYKNKSVNIAIPFETSKESQNKYDNNIINTATSFSIGDSHYDTPTNRSKSNSSSNIDNNNNKNNDDNTNKKTSVPNLYSMVVNHIVTSANKLRRSFSLSGGTSSRNGDHGENKASITIEDVIVANNNPHVCSIMTKRHSGQLEEVVVNDCQNKHDVSYYTHDASCCHLEKQKPLCQVATHLNDTDQINWPNRHDYQRKIDVSDCSVCRNKSSSIYVSSEAIAPKTTTVTEKQQKAHKTKKRALKLRPWVKVDQKRNKRRRNDTSIGNDDEEEEKEKISLMLKPPSSLLPLIMMNSDTSTISSNVEFTKYNSSQYSDYDNQIGQEDHHHHHHAHIINVNQESINSPCRCPKEEEDTAELTEVKRCDTIVSTSLKGLQGGDSIVKMNATTQKDLPTDRQSTTVTGTFCNRCCCCRCSICQTFTQVHQQHRHHNQSLHSQSYLIDKSSDTRFQSANRNASGQLEFSSGSFARTRASSGDDTNSTCDQAVAIDSTLEAFKIERASTNSRILLKSSSMNTSESSSFENENPNQNNNIKSRMRLTKIGEGEGNSIGSGSSTSVKPFSKKRALDTTREADNRTESITTKVLEAPRTQAPKKSAEKKEDIEATDVTLGSLKSKSVYMTQTSKKYYTPNNFASMLPGRGSTKGLRKGQQHNDSKDTPQDIVPRNSSSSSSSRKGVTSAVINAIDPVVTVVNEAAVQRQHRSVGRKLSKLAKERKAAKTLGIVMGVFIVCWLPFFVANIITAVCGIDCIYEPQGIMSIVTWLGWLNSAMNPVIYACWSRDFRRAFRKVLCSWVEFVCPYGGSRVTKKLKLRKNNSHNSYQHGGSSSTNGGTTTITISKATLVSSNSNPSKQSFSPINQQQQQQTSISFNMGPDSGANQSSKFQRVSINGNRSNQMQIHHFNRLN